VVCSSAPFIFRGSPPTKFCAIDAESWWENFVPCSHYREHEKFQNRAGFLGTIGADTRQHELYEKFKHPAFSHLAVVMLSRLGGRGVLFHICKFFRTPP
jgi:hypothetical protein